MSSPEGSLLEMSNQSLTGKARAKARAEAWKRKQNERFIAEMDAEREKRLFPGLDEQGRAAMYARYAEIERCAEIERRREATRENRDTVVEPTVQPGITTLQTITLPVCTVPLTVAIQDIHAALRQRAGPSLSSWFPPEVLYRFSHAQLLYFVDPVKYHSLSTVCDYLNFDGIVRTIQLNARYVDEHIEVLPEFEHLSPRCITLESVDRYRHMPIDFYVRGFPEVLQYDLCLMRTMRPRHDGYAADYSSFNDYDSRNSVLPENYDLRQLHQDGRLVEKCLQYYLPSDSDYYRPSKLLTSLLPQVPYLALINQLPIAELAFRDRKLVQKAVFPESFKMTFPLDPRVEGPNGFIPILRPNSLQREELIMMVKTRKIPAGYYSAWDMQHPGEDSYTANY